MYRMLLPLLVLAPLASATGGPLTLKSVGGATLGGITTVEVSGTPGDKFLVILSLSGGPTALPLPHQPSSIDVGFELLELSLSIPGFLGTIPAGGTSVVPLPMPLDPILTQITLHLQALRIQNNVKFDGKSNPWKWRPALPGSTRSTIGTMPVLRAGHAVVSMPDGGILFFGGGADGVAASYGQKSIDRYDPGTETWTYLGDMLNARASHTATRFTSGPLAGKILITGGADDVAGEPTALAELYDPVANSSTPLPSMAQKRALHTATLLLDGRVLIVGGSSSFAAPGTQGDGIATSGHSTSELFNPATQTWAAGPSLNQPKTLHSATRLNDGRVIVAGGVSWFSLFGSKIPFISATCEFFQVSPTQDFVNGPSLPEERFAHGAILLDSGNVLAVGGGTTNLIDLESPIPLNTTVELIVSGSPQWVPHSTISVARAYSAVARLANGNIVIAGGAYGQISAPTPDPTVDVMTQGGNFVAALQMSHPRANFTATTLVDGTVLLAGGGEAPDPSPPFLPLSFDDAEILH